MVRRLPLLLPFLVFCCGFFPGFARNGQQINEAFANSSCNVFHDNCRPTISGKFIGDVTNLSAGSISLTLKPTSVAYVVLGSGFGSKMGCTGNATASAFKIDDDEATTTALTSTVPQQVPLVCHARDFATLVSCANASSGFSSMRALAIAVSAMTVAPGCKWRPPAGVQPSWRSLAVVIDNNSAPVIMYGSGAALPPLHGESRFGGVRRLNATQALLTVVNSRVPVRVVDMQFEEPQVGKCWDTDRCGWVEGGCIGQIVITNSIGVSFERCSFVRGKDITIELNAPVVSITFSKSLWFHHQTFGLWSGPADPKQGQGANGVHLLNNVFYHGQNNAIIAHLNGSIFQANKFLHNHHVACFNASGGQVCLGSSTNVMFRSNVIANGAITDGDPRFRSFWSSNSTPFQTHGFELTSNLVNMTVKNNDIRNNTGYSIIADRPGRDFAKYYNTTCKKPAGQYAFCPGNFGYPDNDTIHLEHTRFGSVGHTMIHPDAVSAGPARTICANPYWCNESAAPWLIDDSDNCVCTHGDPAGTSCPIPLRPRGQIAAAPTVCVVSAIGVCNITARFWSKDIGTRTVRARVLNGFGVAFPAHAFQLTSAGGNGTVSMTLRAPVVFVAIELWLNDWGLLDKTFASLVETGTRSKTDDTEVTQYQSIPYFDKTYIVVEAENLTVTAGLNGWSPKVYGRDPNHFASVTFNTFMSRRAYLHANGTATAGNATATVNIVDSGQYFALVRYEGLATHDSAFRVQIEQNGVVVYDRVFGRLTNWKMWAFASQRIAGAPTRGGLNGTVCGAEGPYALAQACMWNYGASENNLWEGSGNTSVGHPSVTLQQGLATVTLSLDGVYSVDGCNHDPARCTMHRADRNLDLVMLVSNLTDIQKRVTNDTTQLPSLDGLVNQHGEVFARAKNTGKRNLTLIIPATMNNAPEDVLAPLRFPIPSPNDAATMVSG